MSSFFTFYRRLSYSIVGGNGVIEAKSLNYELNALEPYIDERTMDIHYNKHYKGYVKKVNEVLAKYPEYQYTTLVELIRFHYLLPQAIRQTLYNNAGGVINHENFFFALKKGTTPSGNLKRALEENFGSVDEFKRQFKEEAMKLFGSGWIYLTSDSNKDLWLLSLPNQDTVEELGFVPIIGIDLWEHAYYLKYQNRKEEYIHNFFQVIDWDEAEKRYNQMGI